MDVSQYLPKITFKSPVGNKQFDPLFTQNGTVHEWFSIIRQAIFAILCRILEYTFEQEEVGGIF
jgi:hypothetical protein